MNDFDRLQELITNMPRSYEDAVLGVMKIAREENCAKELISFIESDPQATPSDLLAFINNEIWNIPDTDEYKEYINKKAESKDKE